MSNQRYDRKRYKTRATSNAVARQQALKEKNKENQKTFISKLINFLLVLVLVGSLGYIAYTLYSMNKDVELSLVQPEQEVIEPKQKEVIVEDEEEDICTEYVTDINSKIDLSALSDGDFLGYMIFPDVSDEKWQVVNSSADSGNIDSILDYSIAMDGKYQRLGTYGNTVMFGHDYMALKNIDIYDGYDGYIVLVVGNNTYVYQVYEYKQVSETAVDYVYGLGDESPYTYEEVIDIINEVGVADINNLTDEELSQFEPYIQDFEDAGFTSLDLLTIYTCTQENLWSPITGRTVIKLQQVEETNRCS